VKPNGSKFWHFRYTYQGRAARMSLGVYPHISLQEVRERAAECRNLFKQGINHGIKHRDDKLRPEHARIKCAATWLRPGY
jgi:hypothetical protein